MIPCRQDGCRRRSAAVAEVVTEPLAARLPGPPRRLAAFAGALVVADLALATALPPLLRHLPGRHGRDGRAGYGVSAKSGWRP
jgi:hypothetical protein